VDAAGDSVAPLDVTPAVYKAGSVKQDPKSLTIAVRTALPDVGTVEQDWSCVTVSSGSYLCGYSAVSGWPDIYIAP
jgi:hypothetical protein